MNLRINDQNVDPGKIIMLKQNIELEEITVTEKIKQVPTINYVTRKIESGGVLSSQLTMSPFPASGGTGPQNRSYPIQAASLRCYFNLYLPGGKQYEFQYKGESPY